MTPERITPPRLREGERIGIVAPSAYVTEDHVTQLEACINALAKRFKIHFELSPHFRAVDRFGVSAGTAQQRASDINHFFARDDINAIWCFQGGDTSNQLLDLIDFELIKQKPKIFIGLSDITVLLNAIYSKSGLITFHATDPKAGIEDWHMASEYSQHEFGQILFEGRKGPIPPTRTRNVMKEGNASGQLIGGNLRCMLKLAGTRFFPELTGKILLLEGFTVGSHLSEVLCNIAVLTQQKHFDKLAGVIIGQYYGFDKDESFDNRGEKLLFEELFIEEMTPFSFPILKSFDFGHRCPSTFLPIGAHCSFDTDSRRISLEEKYLR